MNFRLFVLVLLLGLGTLVAACGGKDEAAQVPATDSQEAASGGDTSNIDNRSPEDIATAFMEAGNAADQETFLGLLTEPARVGLAGGTEGEEDGSFGLTGNQFESFTVGSAETEGTESTVPIDVVENGQPQKLRLKMRIENEAWRIYGMEMTAGDMSITMNFEDLGKMMQDIAEGMGEAMKEGFESSMNEWQAGGSKTEIAAERATFDALVPIDEATYRSMFTNTVDFSGKSLGDALQELAARLGLRVDLQGNQEAVDTILETSLTGLSHLEAIERACKQAGLHPQYPELQGGLGALGEAFVEALTVGFEQLLGGENSALKFEGLEGEEESEGIDDETEPGAEEEGAPAITLAEGPREYPIAFVGPFMVDVFLVNEVPPHGTGTLSLRVRTFGFHPALLKLIGEDGQATQFPKVVDSQNRSLIDDDVRYFGGGQIIGTAYLDMFHLDLRNLLRDVTQIERIEGTQKVFLPLEVIDVIFENPTSGQKKNVNGLTLEIKEISENSRIDIQGPEDLMEGLEVLLAADDAQGEPLGIMYQDAMQWMPTQVQATINTPSTPATLRLKLLPQLLKLDYTFNLGPVPLTRYEEMPEKIEALDFGNHEAPLTGEFVQWIEDDPNFPEVEIRVHNHSNKDISTLFADFIYVNDKGEKLENMPTTITGEFGMEGHAPLARAGETRVQKTMAFTRPGGAAGLYVEPMSVEFVDGTKWEGEHTPF